MRTFLVSQTLSDKSYVGVDCSALMDALLELTQVIANQQGRVTNPDIAHALAKVAREGSVIDSKPILKMKKI